MSSPQVDISGWPNIDQVAAITGISRRTLERELADGKWQTRKRPRTGKKPEVVFDPAQVASRAPQPVRSLEKHSANSVTVAESQEAAIPLDAIAQVVTAVMERFMGVMAVGHAQPKLFCALEEGSEISGLSAGLLRKLAKEGKLAHVMDADKSRHYTVLKIKRAALEAFHPE